MTTEKKLDKLILSAAASLLREASGAGSKIKVEGSYGGGDFGEDFKQSEARATTDPRGLCADLGITAAKGETDLAKAASVLNQAITKNGTMREAFDPPNAVDTAVNNKGQTVAGYAIDFTDDLGPGNIGRRNATKFLYATLLAAELAGFLRLEKGVGFSKTSQVDLPTIYGKA